MIEMAIVGLGSWGLSGQISRDPSAILVNLRVWNWRVTPTLLLQWLDRKKALRANAASDTGGGASESRTTKRLKALAHQARELPKSFMHNHLPRYVLRVLSRVGLVWLPEDVLTTLARRGTDVTVIASPEDAEQFTAKGGRAALDRLQWTSQPPRLIATPTGDHSAHHPAILAAIRNAVLYDPRSSLFGSGFAAPTPNRLASALVSGDPIKLFGNGTNAQPGCSGAACNGGAGGAGGLGSTGGNGGNTGDLALFGSGGAGGNGDPTFTFNGGDAGAGAR
jgi:hypothetical protein